MPLYEINHTTPLPPPQRCALAAALTALHTSTFSTPSVFVNVVFRFNNGGAGSAVYVGGVEVTPGTNYIIGHIRPRPNKSADTLDTLVEAVTRIWNEHVHGSEDSFGRLDSPRDLHNVFIMENIGAGTEQGFILPVAGQDAKWAEENMEDFERRARDGDESMKTLVAEVKRGLGSRPLAKSKM